MSNASNRCKLANGAKAKANARLVVSIANKTVRLICLSKINSNSEIIITYGKSYHCKRLFDN